MDSSRVAIRVLVSSALAALSAALIVVGTISPVPERKATAPKAVSASVAPAQTRTQELRHSSPDTYVPVAQSRRTALIDNCFSADLGVTAPASRREIALVEAALAKNWGTVRQMLDNGASIDSANDAGVTPLMVAGLQGDADMIGALIRRQAKVNCKDLGGRSALCYAIQSGKLAAVQSLLPLVSDFETESVDGRDLLTMAFEGGDMNIFQALLERLPETLQWTRGTRAALEMALRFDQKEQVCLLLSKHHAPPTPEGGSVPLIAYALVKGDTAIFNTLLTCGSDPNSVIPKTAEKEFLTLVKSKYLRLYIREETGINLLMLAAGLGKTDYVGTLLDAGADRHQATPRERMRPLHFAAWTGNWRCVQMLLGSGPLPDQLHLEISLAKQNMAVIKDGVTVFTTQCSTGREGFTTPTGQYVITDKDRDHRSTIYKVPMPYFMRLSCRDFGMHGGAVPTYPSSHGCIRLPSEAARKLFVEIPVGTVVMIN